MVRCSTLSIFVFLGTYQLCAAASILPDGLVVNVPTTAKPGYVVTVLDASERHETMMVQNDPDVHATFRLNTNGWLFVKRHLSGLSGTKYTIRYVQIARNGDRRPGRLTVKVEAAESTIQFRHQPYTGHIDENQPPGSVVRGLDSFVFDVETLPYGCQLKLLGYDSSLVSLDSSRGRLITRISLDREQKPTVVVGVLGRCTSGTVYAVLTVLVDDVNDNTPQMDDLFYTVSVSGDSFQDSGALLRVHATDPDKDDDITYHMEPHPDFFIDPETGDITVTRPGRVESRSYELRVFAADSAGHLSEPAFVRIEFKPSPTSRFRRRYKRAVRPTKTFVIRRSQEGELFTVAADYDNTNDERFDFYSPDPEGLEINPLTGMVSLIEGYIYNESLVSFRVNVTRETEPGFEHEQPVDMHVVDRAWMDPIFTNQPQDMYVTIPEWIRPDTTIYTVQALDAIDPYLAPVTYQIEAGAEGCFTIDKVTGDVKIACRRHFVLNQSYPLSISAQNVGAALTPSTPTQTLVVQVGERPPQFYSTYDDVRMSESTDPGASVVTIQCLSHQNVPIIYSLRFEDTVSPGVFEIDSNTGVVTLMETRSHIRDPHQYRMTVTATEPHTGYRVVTDLIINLDGENIHTPYFPGTVYPTETDISEDVAKDIVVIEVEAIDLDFGVNGMMTFSVNDSHFNVTSSDGKVAVVRVASRLDYDRIPLHRYDVTLTAVDRGMPPRTATTVILVWMKDVPDEPPVLEPATQVIRLNQDAVPDTLVHVIQAYDPDVGDTFSFTFEDGNSTKKPFYLDPNNGSLFLKQKLGLDDPSNLTIKITDNNGMSSTGSVIIEVIGVNHPPNFTECDSYTSVSLREHEPPGTSVLNITVKDTDPGVNGDLTFEVYSSLPNLKLFDCNASNVGDGTWNVNLVSLKEIDRESPLDGWDYVNGELSYQLTILARDNGSPSLAATCFFFVRIEDINDHEPQFDGNPYRVTIPTDLSSGSRVIRLFAVDVDVGPNAEFEYKLVDQDPNCVGCFNLDPISGWITKANQGILTDDTKYTVSVTWSAGSLNGSNPVDVTITAKSDPNDLPPMWNDFNSIPVDDMNPIKIDENTLHGEIPGVNFTTNKAGILETVRGATPYENSRNTFDRVTYGESAIVLTVNDDLDYETVPKFSVRIRASMKGIVPDLPYTDARVRIDLTDVNDKTPEFVGRDESRTYPAAISDQTKPGDKVVKVTAIDGDGTSEHNTVTYAFSPTCGEACSEFLIENQTGVIRANTTYSPDRTPQYYLVVVGTDNSPSPVNNDKPLSATATVRVEVTGTISNSPYFPDRMTTVTVESGIPLNTAVHTLVATDPTGQSSLQYSIMDGNTKSRFAVDITTGDIYNVHEILYEDQIEYNLTCAVFDGMHRNTTTINIKISQTNVYPPIFKPDRWYNVNNILENDTTQLYLVNVSAIDPEGETSLTYLIEGAYVDAGFFKIQGSTIYKLKELDRDYPDGHESWVITVTAQENGATPVRGYSLLTVKPSDINDNPPWFDNCCLIGYVQEDAAKGSVVLQLVAHDYDEGGNATLTFGAVQIPENEFGQELFRVESSGSVLTNVDGSHFNINIIPKYKAVVYVQDPGNLRINQTIDILVQDVNNHVPVFDSSQYVFQVDEESPIGTAVGVVYATDNDTELNARLTFTLTTNTPYFYIDSLYVAQAGVIRVKQVLDYEDSSIPNTFSLDVSVTDGAGSGSASTSVSISVSDVNDNAPVINPKWTTVSLDENSLNSNITTYSATDPDSGQGGLVHFRIDYKNTDPDKRFWIHPDSGVVSLIKELDWELTPLYNLHILAIDGGIPQLTGTATLQVTVNNLDDSPPFGEWNPQFPVVDDSTVIGTEVVKITVNDTDSSPQDVDMKFDCNEPLCKDFAFSYTPGTGIISAARNGYNRLDLGFPFYDLHFTLKDSAGNTAPQIIRINIGISNTAAHSSGTSDIYVYNYKASLPDTNIGSVYCDDPEGWDTTDKTFTPQQNYVNFNISSNTGTITMKRGTPRGQHVLDVQVYDSKHQVSALCSVNVFIFYVYDDAVDASGSIRIIGITPEELVFRDQDELGNVLPSKYDILQQELAKLVGATVDDVIIFSVINSTSNATDVIYAVKNPFGQYYRQSKINGLAWHNKQQLSTLLGATVTLSPVSLCTEESCFGSGCNTVVDVLEGIVWPVYTDQTTLIGIQTGFSQECICPGSVHSPDPPKCQYYTCANNGTCEEYYNGYRCTCLEGFEGPHCEQTKLSFSPGNWAWFDPLPACDVMKISLDLMTLESDCLLLYNGPMFNKSQTTNTDYLALQLVAGYPELKLNVGNEDLMLKLTGKNQNGTVVMAPLDDGKWHTIEIFKSNKDFRLVVDHCLSVTVNETLNSTFSDRTPCDVNNTTVGVHSLIDVFTPLELGGRVNTGVDHPTGISGNTFSGCIRNVWINGMLYDLHIGDVGHGVGVVDDCPQEGCSQCPSNSTCSGSLDGSNPVCTCLPGYREPDCTSEAPVADFTSDTSFIEWEITNTINTTLGPNSFAMTQLSLQFRTRQENGVIFECNSFSTLERMILEVVSSYLQFRYDLGQGDRSLALRYVNVSDGVWHTVVIHRYGNQVTLWLDGSEGKYHAEVWPYDGLRHLVISNRGTYGAASVHRNVYSQQVDTAMVLANSCLRDIRLNRIWIPMFSSQNPESSLADVIDSRLMDDVCESDACSGVVCPHGTLCQDIWRENMCICPSDQMFNASGVCVSILDCSIRRCHEGVCVMVQDPDNPEQLIWRCNCKEGWAGVHCNETAPLSLTRSVTVSTGWMSSVFACLLLLLILLVIVVCCTKKRKEGLLDEPDFAKEVIMEYDEDGGGEEDMQTFDLRPLQKPVEVMRPLEKPMIPLTSDLLRTAPDPMHPERRPVRLPTDAPRDNVGLFIADRLSDADNDQMAPPYDSVREYEYEGEGSLADTMSSIQTTSSDPDPNMEYLLSFGEPFRKLADIYLGDDEEEEQLEDTDGATHAAGRPRAVEDTDRARDIAQELAYKQALASLRQAAADRSKQEVDDSRRQTGNSRQQVDGKRPEHREAEHGEAEHGEAEHGLQRAQSGEKVVVWEDEAGFVQDQTMTSSKETHGIQSIVTEEVIVPEQAVQLYRPDHGIQDQQQSSPPPQEGRFEYENSDFVQHRGDFLDQREVIPDEGRMVEFQQRTLGTQDTGDWFQNAEFGFHQEFQPSQHVEETLRTTRVVKQTARQLTETEVDADIRSSQRDRYQKLHYDRPAGAGVANAYVQLSEYAKTPADPEGFDASLITAASSRVVTMEHVTWTENKQVQKIDEYSEV